LSGQKKPLAYNCSEKAGIVGIAVNRLDDIEYCLAVCQSLLDAGYSIRLRWHPRQDARDISGIEKKFKYCPQVDLNDPNLSNLGGFFRGLGVLIAGNSSIHLEAALSGIKPAYFEFSSHEISDYYGYVARGIAEKAESVDELLAIVTRLLSDKNPIDSSAVKYFSHTYGTEWFGHEGQLVADSLMKLADGSPPSNIFGHVFFKRDNNNELLP
jgi:hypothetical protein